MSYVPPPCVAMPNCPQCIALHKQRLARKRKWVEVLEEQLQQAQNDLDAEQKWACGDTV